MGFGLRSAAKAQERPHRKFIKYLINLQYFTMGFGLLSAAKERKLPPQAHRRFIKYLVNLRWIIVNLSNI